MVERPRGTRDFEPEEMFMRKQLLSKLRSTTDKYGYHEVKMPTFEHLDLFTMRSGPDIVGQLYNFEDKSGRKLALRPELTASAMRFYVNSLQNRPKPLKLYYFDNCFRYERPQRGRYREFWQFGAEFIGASSEVSIAELLSMSHKMISGTGLKDFRMKIGYLEIINGVIGEAHLDKAVLSSAMVLIDKKNITGLEELLYEHGCEPRLISEIIRLIDIDESGGNEAVLDVLEGVVVSHPECRKHLERFKNILQALERMNVLDYIVDPGIVRGLDYYTGAVFEVEVDSLGAQKQICGGGEYSLVPLFGGREVATAGFALGFDRLYEALVAENYTFRKNYLDIFFIPITSADLEYITGLGARLREEGFKVDIELNGRKMGKALRYASSLNAKFAGIVGGDEVRAKTVSLKNLKTGEQVQVAHESLASHLLG